MSLALDLTIQIFTVANIITPLWILILDMFIRNVVFICIEFYWQGLLNKNFYNRIIYLLGLPRVQLIENFIIMIFKFTGSWFIGWLSFSFIYSEDICLIACSNTFMKSISTLMLFLIKNVWVHHLPSQLLISLIWI